MEKTKKKSIFKICIFLFVFVICYVYASIVFLPKSKDDVGGSDYSNVESIKAEKKNSLDVIFYGNSDLSSAISPLQLYYETGVKSYNQWLSAQTMNGVVMSVKKTLKRQKPKIIVLETDVIATKNDLFNKYSKYELSNYLAPFLYKSRLKSLKVKDFITLPKPQKDFYKGYMLKTDICERESYDYMNKNEFGNVEIEKSIQKKLDELVAICKKRKIKLLFMESPSPSTWNNKRHKVMKKYADNNNIEFIDFNTQLEGFKFDQETYFRDNGNHLNIYGAVSVTNYIGKYIKNNFELEDRRGSNFCDWDKDSQKYMEEIKQYYDSVIG